MSGFQMFIATIPFNLYALLTLFMVFFTSGTGFDFGLMKKHEENAAKGDLFTSGGEEFQQPDEDVDVTEGGRFTKGKVVDLVAPMLVLIFSAVGAMIWTGHLNGGKNIVEDFANCSSSESLVFATLVAIIFTLILYLSRRVISFKDFMDSVPEGGKLMMPAVIILVLAWTLKGMTDQLGIGDFIAATVNLNSGMIRFVPVIIFLIAIFIAFSSGTSWGTFAILVPIVVNMFAGSDETMMVISISAVLAGAVCGDHVSPISDTTIMSSSGAQCNHINHVQTQMQYAAVVIAACVIGYVIAGFTKNWWITLILSLAILTTILILIRKYTDRKYMQPDSSENA
jgi:Na+/H+ antiporter NhaC